ncbi:aminoglycoside 3-N-acetyltransferase [Cyclobacterium lianum]|uniref:Aminoglycoside N(3)-acetyltransferase n=1 Tax=Cyclobacterium lianum TaxID=388280 RepID=A0A1M7QHZ7_9BACT|nr:AAC(3) family N-acetyltransferase [Cyclobacterium lianum]SHN30530.1 aminoglycoside 3-N-acetyltransferase [Cyclobacterium lianum]
MKDHKNRLIEDLLRLGLSGGDHLLVHASLNAVGRFRDRAGILVAALTEVLGSSGTLLMPCLSYKTVTQDHPDFDVSATPSCVGGLAEYFRTCEGVDRSLHPTHSVSARGRLSVFFLAEHWKDSTPCGTHSPFARLPEVQGKVMFLGCGSRPNTSMHAIEEKVIPPYLFGSRVRYQLRLKDGSRMQKIYLAHGFKNYEQRYDRLLSLMDPGACRRGKVLDADTLVLDSREMWAKGFRQLKENPFFFVDQM